MLVAVGVTAAAAASAHLAPVHSAPPRARQAPLAVVLFVEGILPGGHSRCEFMSDVPGDGASGAALPQLLPCSCFAVSCSAAS